MLLGPVMLALAARASDARRTPAEKQSALRLLHCFGPEFLVKAGLSTDFGAEVVQFIRYFDGGDPDPALMRSKTVRFAARLKKLFLQADILKELPDQPLENQSATVMVVKQAMQLPAFYVDKHVFTPWPKARAKMECEKIMASAQTIVDVTLKRIDAEVAKTGLFADLCVFDMEPYVLARRRAGGVVPDDDWFTPRRVRLARLSLAERDVLL